MIVSPPPRWALAGLLVAAAALLTAWALIVPVFEAPDEPAHWQYARYVHDHWRLPYYRAGFEEANSPPLYYLAIAPVAADSPLPPMVVAPDADGHPASLAPPHRFHTTDRDASRYRPVLWARMIGVGLALLTVWVCYRAGTDAGGRRIGLTTGAAVAFLPQFSFRNTTLGNDVMVTLFAAIATAVCVRLLRKGFTRPRGAAVAAALAGAYLSKISAITLLAPVALALLLAPDAPAPSQRPSGDGGHRPATRAGWLATRLPRLAVLLIALAIVLPWSMRNVTLYGDPFASHAMRTAVAHLITDRSLFSAYFLGELPVVLFMSFIGLFGWANILLPRWAYGAFGLLALVTGLGLLRGLVARTVDRRLASVLVVTVLAVFAIVVYINLSFTQPQGRYLFPALPAIALLMALGLSALPARLAARAHAIVPFALFAFNVWCLGFVVAPAYHPPLERDVAPGVRRLFPSTTQDMILMGPDRTFRITGRDPGWPIPVDLEASNAATLVVTLQGAWAGTPLAMGAVYITSGADPSRTGRQTFSWRADGQPQTIRIPLSREAGWTRRVIQLRIDPVEDGMAGADASQSAAVRLGEIQLLAPPAP